MSNDTLVALACTGVTIQSPQLDINTVAAGGGSRLFFKNKIFVVGPESAGAHPGKFLSDDFVLTTIVIISYICRTCLLQEKRIPSGYRCQPYAGEDPTLSLPFYIWRKGKRAIGLSWNY